MFRHMLTKTVCYMKFSTLKHTLRPEAARVSVPTLCQSIATEWLLSKFIYLFAYFKPGSPVAQVDFKLFV